MSRTEMQSKLIPDRTTVVDVRISHYDVFIARPSPWGNPFRVGRDGTRVECLKKYRAWLQEQPHLLARIPELRGKRLGCYCAPLPCHGDVLADLADREDD